MEPVGRGSLFPSPPSIFAVTLYKPGGKLCPPHYYLPVPPPPPEFSFLPPALEVQSIATVVKFPSFPTVFEVYHLILSKILGLYSSLALIFFPTKIES